MSTLRDRVKARLGTQYLDDQMASIHAAIDERDEAIRQLRASHDELNRTVATQDATIAELRENNQALESTNGRFANLLNEAEETIANQHRDVAELTTALDIRKRAIDGANEQITQMRTEIAELTDELQHTKDQSDELAELQAERDQLTDEHESERQRIEQLQDANRHLAQVADMKRASYRDLLNEAEARGQRKESARVQAEINRRIVRYRAAYDDLLVKYHGQISFKTVPDSMIHEYRNLASALGYWAKGR